MCKWLDNSLVVAQKHYLKITNAHFGAAVGHQELQADTVEAEKFPQFFTQHVGELSCTPMQNEAAGAASTVNNTIYGTGESIQYPHGESNPGFRTENPMS